MSLNQLYNNDTDLVTEWIENSTQNQYKEPQLDTTATEILKQICNELDQNINVFIMSLEIVEEYLLIKNRLKEKINDPVLILIVAVLLSNKFISNQELITIQQIIDVLFKLTKKLYKSRKIVKTEFEILTTLNGKLPITTTVDDLDAIIAKYTYEHHLNVNLHDLCWKILEYLYLIKEKWFFELKTFYNSNEECLDVFKNLIKSKFYLPACILISALYLTHCHESIDVDCLINDISIRINIHKDHLFVLVDKIIDLIH